MGVIERLWAAGTLPYRDGLYRPDDTALELHVDGPGAWHPDAGRPIPFRLGAPLDVARALEEDGEAEVYLDVETALPDGWMCGGSGGMGNIGCLARLGADRSLRWAAFMWSSNPFVSVRVEGRTAVCANDWGNLLALDLDDPALA